MRDALNTREQNSWLGKKAVVIGGSLGGLLVARVVSDYFQQVTVVERDVIPETPQPRKGVPHGHHVHTIFGGGINVINRLYPNFFDELVEAGATVCDFSRDLCWYHAGVWKARPASDLTSYWQSRPFLEAHVRHRTRLDTDVRFLEQCDVVRLLSNTEQTRITGVEVRHRSGDKAAERLEADLVIDASGRGSQTPKWLESIGYPKPPETLVEVNIGYASRIYEPSDNSRDWQILAVFGTPPDSKRTGYIFPIEGRRWLVSEVGFLKDYPPDDDEGYLEFARGLELPDFYEAIRDAKPLTPVSTFRFPANRWRRYDQLSRFPAGMLVIGDAIASFNPVYGQGMSTCALEVDELRLLLDRLRTARAEIPSDFAGRFFRQSAKIIQVPWMLATQSDFLYPQTRGKRPVGTDPLNWYLIRVLQLCSGNERILKTFYRVMHFIKKPTALFHPLILLLVLGRAMGFKGSYRPSKERPRLPV